MGNKTKGIFAQEIGSDLVICLVKGMGLIIGKPSLSDVTASIKSPRIVQLAKDPTSGQNMVSLPEITGNPEEIFLIEDPTIVFKVRDKVLREHYIKTTTNIQLASSISASVINIKPH